MIMEELLSSETEESNSMSEESHIGESSNNNETETDYTDVFTTHTLFETRSDLINWARKAAREHMMILVVKRSCNGGGYKRGRVYLGCERGGQYRSFKGKNMGRPQQIDVDDDEGVEEAIYRPKRRRGPSKKCGCQFLLKGIQTHVMGPWTLSVDCAVHNHPIDMYFQSEDEFVLDSSEDFQYKKLYKKDALNERAGQSQLQYLMEKLKKHDYYFVDRRCEETNTVKDLFFAHRTSVKLLRAFPSVLLMYCTHKTTKNRVPLLEIVGVTSTDMKFSVACAYLEAEKEDNFVWACNTLKALMNEFRLPKLIVTDTNVVLMNALRVTFPASTNFMCRWHINKKVMNYCKPDMRTDEKWEEFNSYWHLLMFAENETAFNERYIALVENFKSYPDAVNYLIEQWIEPYKYKFVACWTDRILHYGNTTTRRVESHHGAFNKHFGESINLETSWDQIHTSYVAAHVAIKASFEKSRIIVYHKFKSNIFKSLRGMVSIHALELIFEEVERGSKSKASVDQRICGCNLRKTCGVPCAHELTQYIREDKPIPLSAVDDFWKKLDMEESEVDLDKEFEKCVEKLKEMFRNANESGKLSLLKKLEELLKEFPEKV